MRPSRGMGAVMPDKMPKGKRKLVEITQTLLSIKKAAQ